MRIKLKVANKARGYMFSVGILQFTMHSLLIYSIFMLMMYIASSDCRQLFCIFTFGETEGPAINGTKTLPAVRLVNETQCKGSTQFKNATTFVRIEPTASNGLDIDVFHWKRQSKINISVVSVYVIFSTEKYYREDFQIRFKLTRYKGGASTQFEQSVGKEMSKYFPKFVFHMDSSNSNPRTNMFFCYVISKHNFSETTYYVSVIEELGQKSMTESFEFNFSDQTTTSSGEKELPKAVVYMLIAIVIILWIVVLLTCYIILQKKANKNKRILKRVDEEPVVQKMRIK